ncbi:hypothetical protein FA04_13980 [Ensifer adhaerens]|uniref:DUF4326 domain-containing protein n=1 Tax=Ensifer adhaerens TaxID=106592 RepID=A0ABY8HDL9_ENSAD|nr:DUF4326 domain-containing protein [Ensifer adhaerens]ANK73632.1 hypothetical protein FA04_13980 [Ensifer adhaerens]KDP73657.1 hypothetical protein FA04_11185 [Ensifer adhaerens]WFP89707.1 DUF4326 domain-containing protein [Ensifer adhaerens]
MKAIRLQLSRRKGFSLQDTSLAANGLSAVKVARPSKYGNPVIKQDFDELQAIHGELGRPPIEGIWQQHAVKCFDAWIGGKLPELGTPPTCAEIRRDLKGKNLACWCELDDPCHADVLLLVANDAGEAKS